MHNIHPQLDQIYLGYVSNQSIPAQQVNFQTSYVGSLPTWIRVPKIQSLRCHLCGQNSPKKKNKQSKRKQVEKLSHQSKSESDSSIQNNQEQKNKKTEKKATQTELSLMTFIGQIFCALQADHTYNRVIYIFYCQKCRKNYKTIRQQSTKFFKLTEQQSKQVQIINKSINKLSQQAYELQTDSIAKKDVAKIILKAKFDAEQEAIEEAEQEISEEDEEDVQSFKNYQRESKLSKQQIRQLQEADSYEIPQTVKKTQKQNGNPQIHPSLNVPKDLNFQAYRRIMPSLKFPTLLYCSMPIPYNTQLLNPKHKCQYCQSPIKLQVQITEQLLSSITNNLKLTAMDWGSLFIYTCTSSCQLQLNQDAEQQLIVQYESDAIKDDEIKKLKKKSKNRKKEKVRKSKSKSRGKEYQQIIKPPIQIKQLKQEQGDWD